MYILNECNHLYFIKYVLSYHSIIKNIYYMYIILYKYINKNMLYNIKNNIKSSRKQFYLFLFYSNYLFILYFFQNLVHYYIRYKNF